MGLDTDTSKNSKNKEFETLLNEDFKKRDFKEGKIIKAVVSEIGKKHIFVETGLKSEGAIPIEEFKISKELEGHFNIKNILIAYICSKILKIPESNFLKVIKTFKGLPFRSSTIFTNNKLKIVNNSNSTNLYSTINSHNSSITF